MESWKEELSHSVKGTEWNNHKYIRKIGNHYIYPEDLKKNKHAIKSVGSTVTRGGNSVMPTQSSVTGSGIIGGSNAGSMPSGSGSYVFDNKKQETSTATKNRKKTVTGTSEDISKKGEGLGTGPVGNSSGYSGRKGTTSGDTIKLENIGTGSSGGSKSLPGSKENSSGKKIVSNASNKSISSLNKSYVSKGSGLIKKILKR